MTGAELGSRRHRSQGTKQNHHQSPPYAPYGQQPPKEAKKPSQPIFLLPTHAPSQLLGSTVHTLHNEKLTPTQQLGHHSTQKDLNYQLEGQRVQPWDRRDGELNCPSVSQSLICLELVYPRKGFSNPVTAPLRGKMTTFENSFIPNMMERGLNILKSWLYSLTRFPCFSL